MYTAGETYLARFFQSDLMNSAVKNNYLSTRVKLEEFCVSDIQNLKIYRVFILPFNINGVECI